MLRAVGKTNLVIGVVLVFSAVCTFLLGFKLASVLYLAHNSGTLVSWGLGKGVHIQNIRAISDSESLFISFENYSPILAPFSWFLIVGALIWRGRLKLSWTRLGFDSGAFDLFVKMRGASTRLRLLHALLETPKNRLQLADELGLSWKAVDRQIHIMSKYQLIVREMVYGRNVEFYSLTLMGKTMLSLLSELEESEGQSKSKVLVFSPQGKE